MDRKHVPGCPCCGGTGRLCVAIQGCCFNIGGVGLRLLDSLGAELATASTAADGSHCFGDLADGDYQVEITSGLPATYEIVAAEPDPQSVTVAGGTSMLIYKVFCETGFGYGVGGGTGTPTRRFAAIKPAAGYWCAGCYLGVSTYPNPQVKCGDPAPTPATLTFGPYTCTLGFSGCPGYECRGWMGQFTWSGESLLNLNAAFDPIEPPGIDNPACPARSRNDSYTSAYSTFYFQATKTALQWIGPSCVTANGCEPAADPEGLDLCNVWDFEFNRFGYANGICAFGLTWNALASSCDPLLLVGTWTPPAAYQPYFGAGPVSVTLAP